MPRAGKVCGSPQHRRMAPAGRPVIHVLGGGSVLKLSCLKVLTLVVWVSETLSLTFVCDAPG